MRNTIDYYVNNNSTVNICCLDISEAFDRINYHGLVLKLMKRHVPRNFIMLLLNWFLKSVCHIKWGNVISSSFGVSAGVRQGGILSPLLFSIYVNDILNSLNSHGCRMFGCNFGSFMYADDLILIAP